MPLKTSEVQEVQRAQLPPGIRTGDETANPAGVAQKRAQNPYGAQLHVGIVLRASTGALMAQSGQTGVSKTQFTPSCLNLSAT